MSATEPTRPTGRDVVVPRGRRVAASPRSRRWSPACVLRRRRPGLRPRAGASAPTPATPRSSCRRPPTSARSRSIRFPGGGAAMVLGVVVVALGVWQLARGFTARRDALGAGRRPSLLFVLAFLCWAATGRPGTPIDLPGLLQQSIFAADPAHPRRAGRHRLRALRRHQRRDRGADAGRRVRRRAVRVAGRTASGSASSRRCSPARLIGAAARGVRDPLPGQPGRARRRAQRCSRSA